MRSSLAGVILRMKSLNLGAVEDFPFLEAPPKRAIADGYQLLNELGATDDDNALTPIGRELAKLPLDPRVGRMILAARERECAARGAGHRQLAERAGRARPAARAAAGGRPGASQVRRREVGVPRHPQAVVVARELARRPRRAPPLEPQARAAAARQLRLAAPGARMARRLRPAAAGGDRARLARQHHAGDLRAAAPVDARRPARQHRPEERRGRLVSRRPRHPLPSPSGLAPVEEAGPLDRRRRAGRDDPALCPRHRQHRPALAGDGRRPPAEEAAARAALGEEGRAGGRARAGDALRPRRLQQPARRLRHGRSGRGARDLHPRGAGRRRLGDEAAVRRRQPQADRPGRGARAQGAAPGRAGRRRADPGLLRPAGAEVGARRPDLRALVPRRGPAPAEPAAADARGADAPRGRGHHHAGVPADDPARRHRLRRDLPARAGQPARRRHRHGAALRPQCRRRGSLRMAGARDAEGQAGGAGEDPAAAAALAPRAPAGLCRGLHRPACLRRRQPARRAHRRRAGEERHRDPARRLQARAAGAASADEPARRRRARPPARRIAPSGRAQGRSSAARRARPSRPWRRCACRQRSPRRRRRRSPTSGRARPRARSRRRIASEPPTSRDRSAPAAPAAAARPSPPGPSASCRSSWR